VDQGHFHGLDLAPVRWCSKDAASDEGTQNGKSDFIHAQLLFRLFEVIVEKKLVSALGVLVDALR
jgi:hypothetical protein